MVLRSKQNKVENFVQSNHRQKNMGLHFFFCFTSFGALTYQTIKCKEVANRKSDTHVISRFKWFVCVYFKFSLVSDNRCFFFSQCGCYGFDLSTLNWRLLESKNYLVRISFPVRTIWWIQCPRGR